MRLTLSKVALYLAPLLLVLPVRAQTITTVAGNTTWNVPISVRLDAAGNLYAPDYYNHVVYKVDSSGNTTIVAGTYGKGGFAGDGALATSALLDNPSGAVPAPDGTLYITDYTAHRIRKVAPNGIITTYAGTGTGNFKGDGGPAGSAEIRSPSDILIDASGISCSRTMATRESARSRRPESSPRWPALEPRLTPETGPPPCKPALARARSGWEPAELLHRRQWNRLRLWRPARAHGGGERHHHDRCWERNRRRFGRRRPSHLRQSRRSERGGA